MLGKHFSMLHRVVYIFYLSKKPFESVEKSTALTFQVFELNMIQFQKVPN